VFRVVGERGRGGEVEERRRIEGRDEGEMRVNL